MKMPLGKMLGSPSASSWIGQVLGPLGLLWSAPPMRGKHGNGGWEDGGVSIRVSSSVSMEERERNLWCPLSTDHGQLVP